MILIRRLHGNNPCDSLGVLSMSTRKLHRMIAILLLMLALLSCTACGSTEDSSEADSILENFIEKIPEDELLTNKEDVDSNTSDSPDTAVAGNDSDENGSVATEDQNNTLASTTSSIAESNDDSNLVADTPAIPDSQTVAAADTSVSQATVDATQSVADTSTQSTDTNAAVAPETTDAAVATATADTGTSSGGGGGNGDASNFNTYNNTDQQNTTATYVLNTNSMKFHHPSCRSVAKISPENYATSSDSRETLISIGYSACGICNP